MPRLIPYLAFVTLTLWPSSLLAQKEFGFNNRQASDQPYLTPQQTVQRLTVPPEFEVKLFAGEPMLTNPIAFTIDERGRIWAIENFEYPSRTPVGAVPRDRIVILEDTDGDGTCDKRTVFAEGKDFPVSPERKAQNRGAFDLASGIEVGHGGVFVGAAPYLWFIENKDDRAGKIVSLLSGFGSEDTHEMLNTFSWGYDGWLYGLHGVYTQSNVKPTNSADDNDDLLKMNAAIWRYEPVSKKFEVFAEGTSNPWGMDYRNSDGQHILACCVIPHLYHIVPGGLYKRQAGASYNPYAYGLIQEICDHTFHRESGWAHAGLISLDVPHIPKRFHDSVIFGSIHGNSLKQNILKPNGSSYIASKGDDFLNSGDRNVRPLNMKWGPNGDIYLSDWHDQNPCHQALPDSWDYNRGRIYRIQLKDRKGNKPIDMKKLTMQQLVEAAGSDDPYIYRTALRLLYELGKPNDAMMTKLHPAIDRMTPLRKTWVMQSLQRFEADLTPTAAEIRAMSLLPNQLDALTKVAEGKTNKAQRRELASAAVGLCEMHDVSALLHELMQHKEDADDPLIPHLIWYAYEKNLTLSPLSPGGEGPGVRGTLSPISKNVTDTASSQPLTPNPSPQRGEGSMNDELAWLAEHAADNPLIVDEILPRTTRRLAATKDPLLIDHCLRFAMNAKTPRMQNQALAGLVEALQDEQLKPTPTWPEAYAELAASKDGLVRELAYRLAVSFGDPAAIQRAMEIVYNPKASSSSRSQAVHDLARLQPSAAANLFITLARDDKQLPVRIEAARGLAQFDSPKIAEQIVGDWPSLTPVVKNELINTLASRKPWAKRLLAAIQTKTIPQADIGNNTITKIQAFNDPELNQLIETAWGRTRSTPDELLVLIEKATNNLDAQPASFTRGKAVFTTQCAKCHVFAGEGHEVGPQLDGAARDIDYILANVIDPNRVVGAPYFQRIVNTLDGLVLQGLLVEEDATSLTLKIENAILKKITKADLDGPVKVLDKSMMPEGLTQGMSEQDQRDLIRYLMIHPYITKLTTADGKVIQTGVRGNIPLPKSLAVNTLSLTTTITALAPTKTQLLLTGPGLAYKVQLDGQPIAEEGNKRFPMTMSKGVHTLTIEVQYRGSGTLTAQLLDSQRNLRYED